jgi:hypothetical protein
MSRVAAQSTERIAAVPAHQPVSQQDTRGQRHYDEHNEAVGADQRKRIQRHVGSGKRGERVWHFRQRLAATRLERTRHSVVTITRREHAVHD